jgi:hypothetical protein
MVPYCRRVAHRVRQAEEPGSSLQQGREDAGTWTMSGRIVRRQSVDLRSEDLLTPAERDALAVMAVASLAETREARGGQPDADAVLRGTLGHSTYELRDEAGAIPQADG